MQLFLIRHAHAVDAEEDSARPLSDRGRKQVQALAKFLAKREVLEPAEFWHSSLVRARETAELLRRGLSLQAPLTEVTDLEPDDDPTVIARRLKARTDSLALVGHEPYLSALASLLVGGRATPPLFLMKKCSVLALGGAGGFWQVRWQISPDLLA